MKSFDDQVNRMRDIFRGLESYGEGSPSEQATRFRLEYLFPEVIKRARANSAEAAPPEVDLLVSLSGFSPATTILAFELVRPRQLFVISSENTSDSIDVINEHLVVGRCLPARHFHHKACDGTDPLAIYRLVKEAVTELASDRSGDGTGTRRRPTTLIDITGGKKVMSAAAALIAWQLDLRLCYIDSRYDGEMRQPIPGTERLLILDNPTTIFGDQELESALETFRSGAFAAAHERFADLAEAMAEPSRARLLRDVAGLYQAWSDLDLHRLQSLADQVGRELASPLAQVPAATERRLRKQLEFLRALASNNPSFKVVNFFVLGEHYRELRHTDFATLLYYRTVEGVFQQCLRLRYGGFDCATPDYTLAGIPTAELLERYNQIIGRLGWATVTALPEKLGLMNSAVLLHAFNDPLLQRINITGAKGLSHLKRQAEARNQSVLAHGYNSVAPNDCEQLRSTAQRCLRGLWELSRPEEDIDALCATLTFVRDV